MSEATQCDFRCPACDGRKHGTNTDGTIYCWQRGCGWYGTWSEVLSVRKPGESGADLSHEIQIKRLERQLAIAREELATAKQLISDEPRTKTQLPPFAQRLWEACNTLIEKAEFKYVFRHLEEVERRLATATDRLREITELHPISGVEAAKILARAALNAIQTKGGAA